MIEIFDTIGKLFQMLKRSNKCPYNATLYIMLSVYLKINSNVKFKGVLCSNINIQHNSRLLQINDIPNCF